MDPSQTKLLKLYAGSMTSAAARHLLTYLVDYGMSLRSHSFTLRDKGYLHTGRYEVDGKWPYAFIVNRVSVLFYVRRAGRTNPAASLDSLVHHFPDAKQNNRGEIQFHVNSEAEARVLMNKLFE